MSNTDIATTPAAAKVKRPAVTERTWLKGHEETKDPREATGVKIDVMGSGTVEVQLSELSEGVRNACAVFGANIVLTNTMGGLRGDEAMEAMLSRLETLQNGEWTSRKGAEGPRLSLLVQAIISAYAKAGQTKDAEAVHAALVAKGEDGRKAVLANAQVKAEYERLKAEAAQARAQAAAAKAAEETGGELAIEGI